MVDTVQDWQSQKKEQLDIFFDKNFDLAKFIKTGTVSTITGAQIGTFLAQMTNNYRTLKSNIASAATIPAVQAIDVTSGWPSNP